MSIPTTSQLELPVSKAILTFRAPSGKDQRLAFAQYDKATGMLPELIIAIKCLEKVNQNKVDPEDYIETYDYMELRDSSYYFDVFAAMFLDDQEKRDKAKEDAKKLLNGESIVGTQKSAPATVATGKNAE